MPFFLLTLAYKNLCENVVINSNSSSDWLVLRVFSVTKSRIWFLPESRSLKDEGISAGCCGRSWASLLLPTESGGILVCHRANGVPTTPYHFRISRALRRTQDRVCGPVTGSKTPGWGLGQNSPVGKDLHPASLSPCKVERWASFSPISLPHYLFLSGNLFRQNPFV